MGHEQGNFGHLTKGACGLSLTLVVAVRHRQGALAARAVGFFWSIFFCKLIKFPVAWKKYHVRVRFTSAPTRWVGAEVIETVLAAIPSRHVSRLVAPCWLSWTTSINESFNRNRILQLLVNIHLERFQALQDLHTFAPLQTQHFIKNLV